MDGQYTIAEAVAVEDKRIVAVVSTLEVKELIAEDTEVVGLQERVML